MTAVGDQFATPDRATFFEVNRTLLRAWCWGDPMAPPVVLVHGAYDHGRTWDDFAPRLVQLGFHVVAIDVRGHGDSGRLSSGMLWNASTIDLCELARVSAPAPGAPIGMIGHSMGGGQILTAAATMPERFAWLVNLDGLGPPAEGFVEQDLVEVASRSLDEIDKFRSSPPRPWVSRELLAERRGAINIRLPPRFLAHLVEFGTREVEGGFVWKWDPAFRTGIPDGFSLELILAQYHHVTAPTLALVSTEEDAWTEVDHEEAARRVAMFADGRLESVPGAGHYVHVEQPEFVLDRIAGFLDEIGARP
jgi:alpha-beta hydrolase superfamily lysophospholipase